MHLISISVQALTQKLHPCPLLALISSLVTLTTPLINEHVIVSTIGCHTPAQRPSSHSCQKPAHCKVRVVFSKPVHAVRAWGGPPGTNHGLFKAKPSSHHVHSTLPVTLPTSPCPTLSADAEPARKHAETIFSAQCAVWCNQKCTIGFNGFHNVSLAEISHETLWRIANTCRIVCFDCLLCGRVSVRKRSVWVTVEGGSPNEGWLAGGSGNPLLV